jgi:hypothetical protein
VLALQSAIGNREVSRLLAGGNAQRVQAKLKIAEPGDKYEQEADRVAAEVVRQINAPALSNQGQAVQRQMPEENKEDELQMKPMVQRHSDGGMAATPDLKASIQQTRGSGQSLADNIREPMEQAFGANFGGVKIHADAQSDQLNQSIQAKAFTTGQDIFFREGAYEPGSREGQELIAHELTHVVQQNEGVVQRASQSQMRRPKDATPTTTPIIRKVTDSAPIQRKIGFEYEMPYVLSAKAKPFTSAEKIKFGLQKGLAAIPGGKNLIRSDFTKKTEVQQRDYLGRGDLIEPNNDKQYRFEALKKKDELVKGNGFTLEADEGNTDQSGYGKSNTEFVTDAFEENEAGRKALEKALIDFTKITAKISAFAQGNKRKVVHAAEVTSSGGVPGIVIFPHKDTSGVMQVTGAVDLARIPELMKKMNRPELDENEQTRKRLLPTRYRLGQTIGGAENAGPTGKAPNQAESAINSYRITNTNTVPIDFGSDKLHGLVSLMASYIMSANNQTLGYAKTLAPIMARTNFAGIFNLLNETEKNYFRNTTPNPLVTIIGQAVNGLDMTQNLFPHGIYNDPRARGRGETHALSGLTRQKWIEGIVSGTDYLTAADFNKNPDLTLSPDESDQEKGDLESMGRLNTQTEPVGQNGVNAPVFEIRSLGSITTPELMQGLALQIFDFLVKLNRNDDPTIEP